ncbi:MAG: hypothetical protein IE913_07150 [Halothiobacillus sp.]|nr:hypothetical protein [Halothiobacillus sp.]
MTPTLAPRTLNRHGKRQQRLWRSESAKTYLTFGRKTADSRATRILAAFLVVGALAPKEVHFVIGLLGIGVCAWMQPHALAEGLKKASWFWGVLVLAIVVTFPAAVILKHSFFDVLKGFYYLVRLPIFLALGFASFWVLKSRDGLLKAICASAVLSAVVYMARYLLDPSIAVELQAGDRTYIRDTLGAGSYLWSIAIGVALAFPRALGKWRVILVPVIISAVASAIVISTGRTAVVWIAVLLIVLAIPRIKQAWPFQLLYGIVFLFFFLTLTPFLYFGPELVSQRWYESIGYIDESIPTARYSLREINTHWRGFETFLAFKYVFSLHGPWFLWGTGLGDRVPLGFMFNLGGEDVTSIPIFHNGFSLLMVRSGLLGLFLFVMGNFKLIKDLLPKPGGFGPQTRADANLSKLGIGVVLLMVMAFPTISGLYHGAEGGSSIPFILGYITAYLRTNRFVDDRPAMRYEQVMPKSVESD